MPPKRKPTKTEEAPADDAAAAGAAEPKTKRGRPAKKKAEDEPASDVAPTATSAPVVAAAAMDVEEEKPKAKGRGKAKAKAAAEDVSAPADPAASAAPAAAAAMDVEEEKPKAKGRGKAKAKAVADDETAAPAAPAAPAAVAEAEEEKPKAKGRGKAKAKAATEEVPAPAAPATAAAEEAEEEKPKAKGKGKGKGKAAAEEAAEELKPHGVDKPKPAAAKPAKSAANRVVDPMCHLGGSVLEDYDAMTNQVNIGNNNNKFYLIQVVFTPSGDYYCWTRWGRVGEPGQNALLGSGDKGSAIDNFKKKFKDKTKNDWEKRANFVAHEGKYTLIKLKSQVEEEAPAAGAAAAAPEGKGAKGKGAKGKGAAAEEEDEDEGAPAAPISDDLAALINYIFREAKQGLTSSIDANITANGIETPLGVLSLEQVGVGEKILEELEAVFLGAAKDRTARLQELSSRFFTAVPHRFGRSRPPVIDTKEVITQKFELLQLMKDLVVLSKKKGTLAKNDAAAQYASLGCKIEPVARGSKEFADMAKEVKESQERSHGRVFVNIKNIYAVSREEEHKRFKPVGNERTLYHGSRITNWTGLLLRGILLPKVVVTLGVHRTDAGWLGSGIYFGEADTAAGYAGVSATNKTAFMLAAKVSLGKVKDYKKITYGISEPPKGFDSCHGSPGGDSQFYDNEYVVYDDTKHVLTYLIEFSK